MRHYDNGASEGTCVSELEFFTDNRLAACQSSDDDPNMASDESVCALAGTNSDPRFGICVANITYDPTPQIACVYVGPLGSIGIC